MRRILAAAVGSASVLLVPGLALAAEGDPVDVASLATWFADKNYLLGATLALFGAVGALFVAFTLIGGVIPGTAGKAQLDKDRELLDRLTTKMEESLAKGGAGTENLVKAVDDIRDDYNRERNRQYIWGALLYIILGSVVSALLARDILQALAFGAGWSGLIGSLGLKTDFNERKDEKDGALQDLTAAVAELSNRPAPAPSKRARRTKRAPRRSVTAARAALSPDSIDSMLVNAEAALAL